MEVNLSEGEIGVLIKCIDGAIMSYINHQGDAHPSEKRRLEGVSLNKLKEKFCKTLMSEKLSWYPKNPFLKLGQKYFKLKEYGISSRYAEIAPYWDEGADALCEAIKKLPIVNGMTFIPDKGDWLPHSVYEKQKEESISRNLWGFVRYHSENDSHWRSGRDELLDIIRHLPSVKKVKNGIQVCLQ